MGLIIFVLLFIAITVWVVFGIGRMIRASKYDEKKLKLLEEQLKKQNEQNNQNNQNSQNDENNKDNSNNNKNNTGGMYYGNN